MKFQELPNVAYTYRGTVYSDDMLEIIGALAALNPDAPVCWARKGQVASRGVWVRLGTYAKRNGSFIDGQDLTLYVDAFYEYDESPRGRFEGVELNHFHGTLPEGALAAETVDELLDALAQLDGPYEDGDETAPEDEGAPASEDAAEREDASDFGIGTEPEADGLPVARSEADGTETGDAPDAPDGTDASEEFSLNLLANRILLEPDGDPLMHGCLTDRWKFMCYTGSDGSQLVVFD